MVAAFGVGWAVAVRVQSSAESTRVGRQLLVAHAGNCPGTVWSSRHRVGADGRQSGRYSPRMVGSHAQSAVAGPPRRRSAAWSFIVVLLVVDIIFTVVLLTRSDAAPTAGPRYVPVAPPASAAAPYRVAFLGDTYTGGSAMDSGLVQRWPALLAHAKSWEPLVFAVPRLGYVQQGDDASTLLGHVAAVVAAQPNGIVVAAGSSDSATPGAAFVAAADQLVLALQKGLPGARITLLSPFWRSAPTPDVVRMTADIKAVAARHAVAFVDVSSVFAQPAGLVGRDRTYPTDAGQARIFTVVQAALPATFPAS